MKIVMYIKTRGKDRTVQTPKENLEDGGVTRNGIFHHGITWYKEKSLRIIKTN